MSYKIHFLLLCSLLAFFMISCQHEIVFHVNNSITTDYKADGSMEFPFTNLQDAIEQVKTIRRNSNDDLITIHVHKGSYYFAKGIVLDKHSSNIRITAQSDEKVVFTGGMSIPTSIIQQTNIGKNIVSVVDLKKVDIEDFGTIKSYGFSRPWCNSWMELFVNEQPMHLSRWPNKGAVPLGRVIDSGSVPRNGDFENRDAVIEYDSLRINQWEATDDKWIYGCFNVGWAEDALRIKMIDKTNHTFTTDGPTLYGFKSGRPWNKWHVFNVKEETDEAGEYYVDHKKSLVYFIPHDSDVKSITASMLEEPFFNIQQAKDIELNNIIFENSRASLLSLWDTENVKITNCTFRNSGDIGIIIGKGIEPFKENRHEGIGKPICGTLGNLQQHMYADQVFYREGGHDNKIDHCSFYNLAAGAISLGGGNRLTLESGNNIVSNCLFHDNNRLAKSYRPAIHITGVGNKILHCEIFNTPSMAILLAGNNHLIEGNYIHHACQEVEDQGAFYYGRNPSECGNVVRRNLFANIPTEFSTSAVYLDDGACGLTVEGNIFYQGGQHCILLGGGSDNTFTDNVFINSDLGVFIDKRLQNWASGMIAPGGVFEKRLKEVNYLKEPYLSAYPYMQDYWPNDSLPKRNFFQRNTYVGIKQRVNSPELASWRNDTLYAEETLKFLKGLDKEELLEQMRSLGLYDAEGGIGIN